METVPRLCLIALLMVGIAACSSSDAGVGSSISSVTLDGVIYEITDAAIASNCLSLTFSVRGYTPQTDDFPRRGFMPIKDIVIRSSNSEQINDLRPLWGGGGGGGWGAGWEKDEDGRVWMEQEMHYALKTPIPEDTIVPLDVRIVLDDEFVMSEELQFKISVLAGPGGGSCPYPGNE
jgi:hypothetical protein